MNEKRKILLLTTGGTIASVPGGEGLEPHRSGVMERELEQLRTYYEITVRAVMCLDSSNIRPRNGSSSPGKSSRTGRALTVLWCPTAPIPWPIPPPP